MVRTNDGSRARGVLLRAQSSTFWSMNCLTSSSSSLLTSSGSVSAQHTRAKTSATPALQAEHLRTLGERGDLLDELGDARGIRHSDLVCLHRHTRAQLRQAKAGPRGGYVPLACARRWSCQPLWSSLVLSSWSSLRASVSDRARVKREGLACRIRLAGPDET